MPLLLFEKKTRYKTKDFKCYIIFNKQEIFSSLIAVKPFFFMTSESDDKSKHTYRVYQQSENGRAMRTDITKKEVYQQKEIMFSP